MLATDAYLRYQQLQEYVGWDSADAQRVVAVATCIERHLPELIDDFYQELLRHPAAARVITGGPAQIERLKGSLGTWLRELTAGTYDDSYVGRRWQIGLRHAELGLEQRFAAAAMARLRAGIATVVGTACWPAAGAGEEHFAAGNRVLFATLQSINKLLDLDLMIIADAYEAERLRRETESERRRGDQRFRMLVEAAACMVAILRKDGAIAYFSPYAVEMTGYAAEQAVGANFLELLVAEDSRGAMHQEVADTLAGRPTRGSECAIVRSDGSQRWIVWNGQQLEDYLGTPSVLLVGQDFTERRQAHEKMLRTERLAGIGQMIAGLAHESRNALQRIQSCCEMLELEVVNQAEPERLVHRIQEAQDTLHRLFEEVRGYSAPIQLEVAAGNVGAAWREAWQSLEMVRRGRVARLSEVCAGGEAHLPIDRFRMVQVFRNLFENSLAACSDPVEIVCAVASGELAGEQALEIRVVDNGPGLTPAARTTVFEPFFTTKTKGTGLGMAIAHRIVDAHGGAIEVGSRAEAGAEFVITLPRNLE